MHHAVYSDCDPKALSWDRRLFKAGKQKVDNKARERA